ncbi:MAG: PAS domain-containing sensor histidine kinase [Anaerolineae bacterium]|jgi:PAS domain S-box-containing protein|nr:PAS domain-containing sensor histidine kinase [Anaerolineae bacterium]
MDTLLKITGLIGLLVMVTLFQQPIITFLFAIAIIAMLGHHLYQTQCALHESEIRFQALADATFEGIVVSEHGRIIDVNSVLARMFGFNATELIGRDLLALCLPETAAKIQAELLHHDDQLYQLQGQRKDGTIFPMEVRARRLQIQGRSLRVGVVRDLTAAKAQQESQRRETELLRALIDHSPDLIFVKDTEGRYLLSNKAFAQMAGAESPEAMFGTTFAHWYPPEIAAQNLEDDQEVLLRGLPCLNLERALPVSGGNRWLLTTKVPLYDPAGQVIGLVGIGRDITELKEREQQALELTLEREKVEVLADFITATSHELRTPLSVINTCVHLISRQTDPMQRKTRLDLIREQVNRLSRLISDMQTMARLDRAKLDLSPVSLQEISQRVIDQMSDRMIEKGIQFHYQQGEGDYCVMGDAVLLERALLNLLDNAIRYTPKGGTINLDLDATHHQITVRDSGPGIPDDDLPYIFDRFYKGNHARTQDQSGAGLGLSMVKRIVDLHHGMIEVESTLNQGTVVRLSLPKLTTPHRTR